MSGLGCRTSGLGFHRPSLATTTTLQLYNLLYWNGYCQGLGVFIIWGRCLILAGPGKLMTHNPKPNAIEGFGLGTRVYDLRFGLRAKDLEVAFRAQGYGLEVKSLGFMAYKSTRMKGIALLQPPNAYLFGGLGNPGPGCQMRAPSSNPKVLERMDGISWVLPPPSNSLY